MCVLRTFSGFEYEWTSRRSAASVSVVVGEPVTDVGPFVGESALQPAASNKMTHKVSFDSLMKSNSLLTGC
jgi:hypothetical protein